jgi:hypothetical protein
MIIREILTDTEKELENFDFFNDYSDTLLWLIETGHKGQAIELKNAYTQYITKRNEKYSKPPTSSLP